MITCDKSAYKLMHDATVALSQVESNGIRIDVDYLQRAIRENDEKIAQNTRALKADPIFQTWKKRFGEKTNIGSNEQLAIVLFDCLGYKSKGRTATGKHAADEASFAHVDIEFVKLYFQNEKLKKAGGTYLTGILRENVYGYVHPNFNLHKVVTYRSSSDNPNFQNIPKRNKEMASIIRRCYIPRDGHVLCEVDFSGAEVRVSACYNKDKNLLNYIKDPTTDMHRDVACQVFMLKPDEVDKKKGPRDCCKNMFVFPAFYGSVYFQTAPDMWEAMHRRQFKFKDSDKLVADHLRKKGITALGDCNPKGRPEPGTFAHHVQKIEKDFWDVRFRGYRDWKKRWWADYLRHGGFKMYTGFACNGVFKRNDVLNYAIQGSSFHCLLWSLIQVQRWLNKNKMKTKIVGQIHDSIVADVHESELEDYLAYCKQVITHDLPNHWKWIIVPIEVEADISQVGGNWSEMTEVSMK